MKPPTSPAIRWPAIWLCAAITLDPLLHAQVITTLGTNVGIGVASPAQKLEVGGTIRVQGGGLFLDNDQVIRAGGGNQSLIYRSSSNGIYLGSGDANDFLVFNSGGNEKVRITTAGNVGIGTANPQARLQVMSTLFVNSTGDSVGGLYYGNASSGLIVGNYGSAPWPGTNGLFVGGNALLMGNVGIGTATPSYKLDVNGSINASNIGYAGANTILRTDSNNYLLLDSWIRGTGIYNTSGDHAYFDGQYFRTRSNYGIAVSQRDGTTRGWLYFDGSENFGLLNKNGNWAVRTTTSFTEIANTLYAPIMCDSNNAAYRVDPNGDSRLEQVIPTILTTPFVGADSGIYGDRPYQWGYQEGGPWTWPYPDLIIGYHTGLKLGAHYTYGGTRIYADHPSRTSTLLLSVGDGDYNVRTGYSLFTGGGLGVGTSSPRARVEIDTPSGDGSQLIIKAPQTAADQSILLRNYWNADDGSAGLASIGFNDTGGAGGLLWFSTLQQGSSPSSQPTKRLLIDSFGRVGIGTTSPQYQLHVAGAVRASQFIADSNTYADFVFKPDYKLPSLADVEHHIQEHGHLPDIPSEAEAKRDGVDMAQLQVKLLQKVEELTLHLIRLEKENNAARAETVALKGRLVEQAERIQQLEDTLSSK